MEVDEGFRQPQGGVLKRLPGCVGVGDAGQQPLEGTGSTQPLQITHQSQRAIGLASPAQGQTGVQLHPQLDGLRLLESPQLPTPDRLEPETLQAGGQTVGVVQHRWQDGEVGHGANARFF